MRAMPTCLIGNRQQDKFTVVYSLNVAIHDLQFGRIDYIIGGVYRGKWNGDLLEIRLRVVIPGGIKIVEHVVGVGGFHALVDVIVDQFVRLVTSGRLLVQLQGAASHDEKDVDGALQ